MSYWVSSWTAWVSALCVLAIWSYLIKDNALYRTMMQVFVGVTVGYNVVVQWRDILYPQWWLPMLDGVSALFFGGPGSPWGALWVLVGLLGLLWYFQLSKKLLWLSRITIGITVGIGAGLTFKTQLGQNIPQVSDSFKPLTPAFVGLAPRPLFALPASPVSPLISEPVGYFWDGTRLSCRELLGGVEVWNRPVQGSAVRQLIRDPAGVTLLHSDGTVDKVQLSSGELSVNQQSPEITDIYPSFDTLDAEGAPVKLSVTKFDTSCVVSDLRTGKVFETIPTSAFIGFDEGLTIKRTQSSIVIHDSALNKNYSELGVLGDLSAEPRFAKYSDPNFNRQILLTAAPGGYLCGYQAKNDGSAHRQAGELLWRWKAPFEITSISCIKDVAIISGPQGSLELEVPKPSPSVTAGELFDNWVFVITIVSVMTYFFFCFKFNSKAVKGTARVGRWMLMLGFGAFFGNTVMTRMSFLLDRLMFLIDDWIKPFIHHFFG